MIATGCLGELPHPMRSKTCSSEEKPRNIASVRSKRPAMVLPGALSGHHNAPPSHNLCAFLPDFPEKPSSLQGPDKSPHNPDSHQKPCLVLKRTPLCAEAKGLSLPTLRTATSLSVAHVMILPRPPF